MAADPDTGSGFFYNTNAANNTKQYVLVGLLFANCYQSAIGMRLATIGTRLVHIQITNHLLRDLQRIFTNLSLWGCCTYRVNVVNGASSSDRLRRTRCTPLSGQGASDTKGCRKHSVHSRPHRASNLLAVPYNIDKAALFSQYASSGAIG